MAPGKIDSKTLEDVFILDTGSTIQAAIKNQKLLSNIKPTKDTMQMATNAGVKTMDLKGEVIGLGDAWYDPGLMANIFGFAHMVDKYRVTYDSAKEDAFIVHSDTGVVKFSRTPEGLYAYKPSDGYLKLVERSKKPTVEDHVQVESKDDVLITGVGRKSRGKDDSVQSPLVVQDGKDAQIAGVTVSGQRMPTVNFRVEDPKPSYVNPMVDDEFMEWLNKVYGAIGEANATTVVDRE